jgi:cephalosporin-C deacetylase-like acetyl esterase
MNEKRFTEATPTDFDDFWNNTVEPSGGLTQHTKYNFFKKSSPDIICMDSSCSIANNAVKPNYYSRNGLECYDVIRASMGAEKYKGFLWGNIQKYLWRWEQKNGKQDLEKAAEYLTKLIETLD